MKTSTWLILLVVLVLLAFFLGKYWSALTAAYKNKDKIGAAIDVASGLETIFGK